jgi:hypothetical protein
MRLRVRLHHEAEDELREAALFYSDRAPATGERFIVLVEAGLSLLSENSCLSPVWPGRPEVRRWVLAKFP